MNDECPLCDRLLPPDGDCYGCAADKAWEEITTLRKRLARAEALLDRCAEHCHGNEARREAVAQIDAYKAGKESNAT
jgi:hypothetical protein